MDDRVDGNEKELIILPLVAGWGLIARLTGSFRPWASSAALVTTVPFSIWPKFLKASSGRRTSFNSLRLWCPLSRWVKDLPNLRSENGFVAGDGLWVDRGWQHMMEEEHYWRRLIGRQLLRIDRVERRVWLHDERPGRRRCSSG